MSAHPAPDRRLRAGSSATRGLFGLVLTLGLATPACMGPPSHVSAAPEHLVRLWPAGRTGRPVLGLSTQDGILLLSEPHYERDDVFEVQHPIGNSVVSGHGFIDQLNEELSLVRMLDARVKQGRFAADDPDWSREEVCLALRDDDDDVDLIEIERWQDGAYGDWIVCDADDPDTLARDWAGAGLYVWRDDHWQIVGMLAGVTARLEDGDSDDVGLGYVSLVEIARILPDHIEYFEHDIQPLRPDFEFGVPLQPGDVTLQPPTGRTEPSGGGT